VSGGPRATLVPLGPRVIAPVCPHAIAPIDPRVIVPIDPRVIFPLGPHAFISLGVTSDERDASTTVCRGVLRHQSRPA
jgi:hypothetical protein